MSEEEQAKKMWDHEVPEEWQDFRYAMGHSISHSNREILVQLFNARPLAKSIVVARLILHPDHAQELILNLQTQLKKLKETRGFPPDR